MKFELLAQCADTGARAGILNTSRGEIPTPVFMPVGTQATVKAVHQHELKRDIKASVILGNTYHLYLRPGTEILEAAGGLHSFMNWPLPILTDSGGYQVYSLSKNRKITEEGARFQSHIDGSSHMLSPEKSMDIQRSIGADIVMAFDECPPYPCTYQYALRSMELTHRWLDRCLTRMETTRPLYGHPQAMFPIVQGSTYDDLRIKSAEYVASVEAAGYAIGGLSVGEPEVDLYKHTELVTGILPHNKPRYLMGVGTPVNLVQCIQRGVDMFDCVLPSRNARHGLLYTTQGVINIKNRKWAADFSPLDENLPLATSQTHSKAYLRHLFASGERLGAQLATLQNLRFYTWLMESAREAILQGRFKSWSNEILPVIARRN